MIPEKLGLGSTNGSATVTPLDSSVRGGALPSVTALHVGNVDVVVIAPDPVVILLGNAPASSPTGRPPRTAGTGTSGYASVPAPTRPTTTAPRSTSTASSTASTAAAKTTSAKKTGPLAFLDDSKMSVDEKIFRLSLYMTDKADKELEKKVKEISGKGKAASSSSGGGGVLGGLLGGSGASGLLGGLGGLLGKSGGGGLGGALSVLGPLGSAVGMGVDLLQSTGATKLIAQASGPVLAAGACAVGMPELAPAALKLAPSIVGGAFDAIEGLSSAAGKASSSSSTSSSSSSLSSSADGDMDIDKKDLMELEYMQQKQQQMFSLLSNLMKTMHDTRMSVIGNMRS